MCFLFFQCIENFAQQYLNRADVKKALHVKSDLQWVQCSGKVQYSYSDVIHVSTAPIYTRFQNSNLRILVYSGTRKKGAAGCLWCVRVCGPLTRVPETQQTHR